MKILFITTLFLGATAAVCAGPQIVADSVTFDQDPDTRKVSIGYTLDAAEPAIITIDIQTNAAPGEWVSIGGENLSRFAGDVNKVVAAGSTGTATWQADAAWPRHFVTNGVRAVVTAWATNAPPDYLAVDLAARTRRYYASAAEVPGGVTDDRYKTTILLMRKIPAAGIPWRMGAGSADECGAADFAGSEKPHEVTLSADYYIGVYPVTQRQYLLIHENGKGSYSDVPGGKSPSRYTGTGADFHPVENICYTYLRGSSAWPASGLDHAIASGDMGRIIGRARTITGLQLDLPTEAQWEFAARAGKGSAYLDGTSAWKDTLGWTSTNSGYDGYSRAVGSGIVNAWGLYDLHGNVWELCLDWYDADYYSVSPAENPAGPSTGGTTRATRGGGYSSPAASARLSKRGYCTYNSAANNTGFRLVCPAVVPGE